MESSGALEVAGIERVDRSQRAVLTMLALAGVVGFELALMLPWMLALGLGAHEAGAGAGHPAARVPAATGGTGRHRP
ncbi:hypothetical protein [Rhizobacter sp. SG703]|uniref:hypothetical protein n=1 Tax=Rhizobacter sp. SG703 TaxID=2587140 RepID=UPI001446CCAA|nr:hypothetical protein [Rhizobacter sp. SG703]